MAADLTAKLNANAQLAAALGAVIDSVDYTKGACNVTEMVGAVLPKELIAMSRAALAQA